MLDLDYDPASISVERGRADGKERGAALGFEEGEALGRQAGTDLAQELAVMKGRILVWRYASTLDPSFCSARSARIMDALEALIDGFPRENKPDEDMVGALQACRSKFLVLKSHFQVPKASGDAADSSLEF
jgi:hypothetical protein